MSQTAAVLPPPGPTSRSMHVELPSQQRRLRHLRNIAARNIVNRNGYRLLDTYFTLHLCDNINICKEFYKSEVIKNSLNPTWRSLDFGLMPDRLDTSVSCFVIHARSPNEIIFGLNDGYYGALYERKGVSEIQKNLQVDPNCVRNSYDVFSLLRLHRAQCAIKQTQVTVQKIGREIEEKLRLTSTSNELKKESECLQLKILVLQNELERQKRALGREVALLHKEQTALLERGKEFEEEHSKLLSDKEPLQELRKECTAKREQFLKTNAQLTIRRRQLLSELSCIYPIDTNDQEDYFICGVKLPNSENFQAKDDGSIAVALGYTAHLVSMISYFLQVPLRYPIIHKGSRSAIKDNINDKLTEKEREFPLYLKGGEKLQFDYGVFLLNKNIAQLRYQHGLGTPDLRQTLPNLKNFLEHGLMVRCDRHHVSSAIPVPKRQTSAFGGLDVGFSGNHPSPDKGLRKRANSENERLLHKSQLPSHNSAFTQPIAIAGEAEKMAVSLSSSLDTSTDFSKDRSKTDEDSRLGVNGENRSSSSSRNPPESLRGPSRAINGTPLSSEQPGTAARERPSIFCGALGTDLLCTVEQAEEIMGLEAMGFGSGDQLAAFNYIPVDHAVAVECDDQVLGEFEEFSRRIYALNKDTPTFRRPRKGSDK
ncbi:UV radiation resistance-associated gene protein isoform X2 [Ahaetulla prasina]|uniref:UV radiation resistance-associated gene protein isoform X2 n=1 Tax=Ahaetulla prasina TaxID=499056 RepID=UPI0026493B08|nr:UV radiation resistance-associated gene protein isoform X2 [Ahaetulla prasina]